MSSISVQSRTLVPSSSRLAVPPVLFTADATNITVADLIQQAVARQIAVLEQQQALREAEASYTIERHYLTVEEIAAPVLEAAPEVCATQPGSHTQTSGMLRAVRQARLAFERRAYIIVIDGKIARSLQEEIPCWQDHKVTFLRLVPLVGG